MAHYYSEHCARATVPFKEADTRQTQFNMGFSKSLQLFLIFNLRLWLK